MFRHKKHLFFDLDHTLWDFESNAADCLSEIFVNHAFEAKGVSKTDFLSTFSSVNRYLWTQLEQNLISHDHIRKERFKLAFDKLGFPIEETLSENLNAHFLELLPRKSKLIPDCLEVLTKLHGTYELHILSNGYQEVQKLKMSTGGINHYFDKIITNDIAGARKPDRQIFEYALQQAKAKPQDSLMIGDSFDADILGARNAGLDAIHLTENKVEKPLGHHTISSLKQILDYL
ncbi:MAG: YjjG family noncanonical pyrimidine nucleotidase [Cytophagales bacterium]|nr:YjjG family noncanonical pyrimidine nucleotidase [Cytophagales bacterium]